jgi:SAM-dependent methyltransferase
MDVEEYLRTHQPRTPIWDDPDQLYEARPPWDIGRPQPAFQALADAGAITGRVLDIGCGTGEHALMAAALGLDATGIDLAASALATAELKARQRGLSMRFLRHDARRLAELGERFDTVLDSGLFHIFDNPDRAAYVASLGAAVTPGGRYFMLGFSDTLARPSGGRSSALKTAAARRPHRRCVLWLFHRQVVREEAVTAGRRCTPSSPGNSSGRRRVNRSTTCCRTAICGGRRINT